MLLPECCPREVIASLAKVNPGVNNPLFYVKYDSTGCDSTLPYCALANSLPERKADKMSLYPQPASGTVTLELSQPKREAVAVLHSLEGRVLRRSTVSFSGNAGVLDISDVPPGVYLLSIEGERGFQKLLVD